MPTSHQPITVFSGGSAANSLTSVFTALATSKSCPLAYIIPISDNGGSSSELIRVFGGPGIGDVRSRLVRLVPKLNRSSPGWREREAIRDIFSYRLNQIESSKARSEWNDVVDGTSVLWKDITSAKKELIRSVFNLVNLEIIKRSRPPSSTFDFTSASVGNLFLTGARLFTGSFESGIYLMGSICGVNDEDVKVVPSINSNFSHHIAAGLEDGSVIVGQNAISHPTPVVDVRSARLTKGVENPLEERVDVDPATLTPLEERRSSEHYYGDEERQNRHTNEHGEEAEDANLPGTLPTLRTKNIAFNKNLNEDLPARISRIWYINPYGQEILPPANPRAVAAISHAQAIIYSIGSLYTSLVPSLVLRGVGDALRFNTSAGRTRLRTKILILNGSLDREVGPQPPVAGSHDKPFSALDFVDAIVRAGEQSRGIIWDDSQKTARILTPRDQQMPAATIRATATAPTTPTRPNLYTAKSEASVMTLTGRSPRIISHLFPAPLLASAQPSRSQSREASPSPSKTSSNGLPTTGTFTPPQQMSPSKPDPIYNAYVTHLIHLPNSDSTPYVDRDLLLSKCGIQTVKVYGRKEEGPGGGMRYDPAALRGAIEAIIGRNPEKKVRSSTKQGTTDSDDDEDTEDDEGAVDELTRVRTNELDRRRARNALGIGRRNTVDAY